jgi:hypothetical protein
MADPNRDVDFTELIPKLRGHWATHDIDTWIGIEGDYEYLVGYSRIFWPDFIEHDDCIFQSRKFTEGNYQGFMQQRKVTKSPSKL